MKQKEKKNYNKNEIMKWNNVISLAIEKVNTTTTAFG